MTKHDHKKDYEENWYWYLTGENREGFPARYKRKVRFYKTISALVPGQPRCFECSRPMSGLGGWLTRARPSSFSPRLCHTCEMSIREVEAGAEVELTLLFADVRGSTSLAENIPTLEYKSLIQRFYQAATGVLVEENAMVNRLMGDQVIGLFVPRFAGTGHAEVAVETALKLLRATGYEDPAGPWIPLGVGVHTGLAYVGAVGNKEGVNEIAVLGSAANLAARLAAQAHAGEVLVSDQAALAAGLPAGAGQSRALDLKGLSQPVYARALSLHPV